MGAHTNSTVFHLEESTKLMSLLHQLLSMFLRSMSLKMLMMLISKPQRRLKAGKFFAEEEKPKNTVSDARKADQKSVDDAIMASVKATAGLKEYLGARFALTNGQFPHEMNF